MSSGGAPALALRPLRGVVARAAGVMLAIAWAATPALAQQTTLDESDAVKCLTPAQNVRGAPEYPFVAYKTGETGRVSVQLAFMAPDAPPQVDLLTTVGDDSFVQSVRSFVEPFRVPCMRGADAPVRLRFDFVFKPDTRQVFVGRPADAGDADRRAKLACLQPMGGEALPSYPRAALERAIVGRVIVRFRFDAPDRAPAMEFYARPAARSLQRAVEDWGRKLRMPCLGNEPISLVQVHVFMIAGTAYGFKPGLDFRTLLVLMPVATRAAMPRDTTGMGCPFSVRLWYRQPDLPNHVFQVASQEAAREPFLRWLEGARLDVPEAMLDAIFGDTTTFEVPCLKIDPTPKKE